MASTSAMEHLIAKIRPWAKSELNRAQRRQLRMLIALAREVMKRSQDAAYLGIVANPPTKSRAPGREEVWLDKDLCPSVDRDLRSLLQSVEWVRRSLLRPKEGFSAQELQAVADRLDEIPYLVAEIQKDLSAWVDASHRIDPTKEEASKVRMTLRHGKVGTLTVTHRDYVGDSLLRMFPDARHFGLYPARFKLPQGHNPDRTEPLANGWSLCIWN